MGTEGDISPIWHDAFTAYVTEVKERAHAPGACAEYIRSTNPQKVIDLGRNSFKCLSPLRTEKTPSFYVYPDDRGWHDFGTQESGDLYTFAQKFHHLSTLRATIDHLAEHFGLPNWEDRKQAMRSNGASRTPLPDNLEADMIARWRGEITDEETVFGCATWLANAAANLLFDQVREYLIQHYGLSDEFITLERIGYCPRSFWELVTEVLECPFDRRALLSTGWFHASGRDPMTSGKVSPVFADRIVFVYWKSGQARYAIGRKWFGKASEADLLPEWSQKHAWASGKYLKLPVHSEKRPYVSKLVANTVLWNEDCLKRAQGGDVWISEGMTDAMALAMLGRAVISPVTVAFAQHDIDHVLALLKRTKPARVLIANDNDVIVDVRSGKTRSPGLEGAEKMAETLWAYGHQAYIVRLPRPEGVTKIDVNELVATTLRIPGGASA